MALIPQVHLNLMNCRSDSGILIEYVEVHTYNHGDMGLLAVRGSNGDSQPSSVDIWFREDDIRELRDAINIALGEAPLPPPVPKTPEEKKAFSREWDRRYEERHGNGKRA